MLREIRSEAVWLCVQHIIHVALSIQSYIFRAMSSDRAKTHDLEKSGEFAGFRVGEFDELESVPFPLDLLRRCLSAKRRASWAPS